MSKKIYDILPPNSVNSEKSVKINFNNLEKNKKNRIKNSPVVKNVIVENKRKEKRFYKKEILIGSSIIVFLVGIYIYTKLPKVEIQIKPNLEDLILETKIIADKNISNIDSYQKIIPAYYIEVLKDESKEFEATGSSLNDSKASGTIIIYNKLSPSTPLTLIKGTHFLSDSGKYFITLDKVTIPAAKGKTPGSITVKVQAKESGPDYNIGSANFSVPKLSGTVYYYGIWAESKEKMSGGYTGNLKKVTKEDILIAKEVLTDKLLKQAEESLRNKLVLGDILLEDAILREVIDSSSDIKEGSNVDYFNESAKVKVSGLILKQSDLDSFAKDYINSNLPDFKIFWDKSLNVNYNLNLVDIQKGTETIDLQISGKTYYEIDINELIDLSARKSETEIKDVLSIEPLQDMSSFEYNELIKDLFSILDQHIENNNVQAIDLAKQLIPLMKTMIHQEVLKARKTPVGEIGVICASNIESSSF